MENLLLSFKAIMPVFLPMTIGYMAKKYELIDDSLIPPINSLIYKLFLPVMLFCNIYTGNGLPAVEHGLLWFCMITFVVIFAVFMVITPAFIKDAKRRSAFIHTSIRSNMAIIGLPIAAALCPAELLPTISTVIGICVVPSNIFGILSLELNRDNQKTDFLKGVFYALKSKLVLAIIFSLTLNILHINLPQLLLTPLANFGAVTSPLAFFTLGASFTFSAAAKNKGLITIATLLRLVVIPFLVLLPAMALGFRDEALASIFVIFASPTAVSAYAVSCAMGSDEQLTSEIVVFTSAFSIITVFLWIYAITSMGLIK